MTLSHWQRGELGPTLYCDIAVVGGGIIGSSTAYWLKRQEPKKCVTLLEAQTLGYGASGRNAGFLLQGAAVDFVTDIAKYGEDKARLLWAFTQENRNLIESELDASRVLLKGGGSLILAGSEAENERLKLSRDLLNTSGESAKYWSAAEIQKRIKGQGFFGGLFIPTGARVDSQKLVREIAGQSGAIILEGHPVFTVEQHGKAVMLRTPSRNVIAERVIFCLNAYLPQLLPETSTYVHPVRAQMLATDPHPMWLEYPVYSHEGYFYVRQLDSGSILVGGARHLFAGEEVGYADQTTSQVQSALKSYLLQYFPHLKRITSRYAWSGVMAFTEDGLPLLAPLKSIPGCYWAAGFNGHGMGYGFRFGKLVAGIINQIPDEDEYQALFDIHRLKIRIKS